MTNIEQWQTPKGNYWIAAGSRYVLPFNLAEQERKIYGRGENFVRPGDVVLDCGANIGVFVREALDAGAKTVVAIEPAPENIECLRRNFKDEIACGPGDRLSQRCLGQGRFPHDEHRRSQLRRGQLRHQPEGLRTRPDEKFPLTTIDKLVAELNLPSVDFIKMDIEGAEVKALHGGRATIAKYHPRMALSVYHAPDHPVKFRKLRRKHGPATRSSVVLARLPMAGFGRIFCISISVVSRGVGSLATRWTGWWWL